MAAAGSGGDRYQASRRLRVKCYVELFPATSAENPAVNATLTQEIKDLFTTIDKYDGSKVAALYIGDLFSGKQSLETIPVVPKGFSGAFPTAVYGHCAVVPTVEVFNNASAGLLSGSPMARLHQFPAYDVPLYPGIDFAMVYQERFGVEFKNETMGIVTKDLVDVGISKNGYPYSVMLSEVIVSNLFPSVAPGPLPAFRPSVKLVKALQKSQSDNPTRNYSMMFALPQVMLDIALEWSPHNTALAASNTAATMQMLIPVTAPAGPAHTLAELSFKMLNTYDYSSSKRARACLGGYNVLPYGGA